MPFRQCSHWQDSTLAYFHDGNMPMYMEVCQCLWKSLLSLKACRSPWKLVNTPKKWKSLQILCPWKLDKSLGSLENTWKWTDAPESPPMSLKVYQYPWKSTAALEVCQCCWKLAAALEICQHPWKPAAALEVCQRVWKSAAAQKVCRWPGSQLLPWESANVLSSWTTAALEVCQCPLRA